MNKHAFYGLALALGVSIAPPAAAQTARKVYTYAEQMPVLPHTKGGLVAVVNAIRKNLRYPDDARLSQLEGRVFVSFVVTETGQTDDIKVVKGLSPSCDQAAIDAVRQLPLLVPARNQGQPVAVSFTVPLDFRVDAKRQR